MPPPGSESTPRSDSSWLLAASKGIPASPVFRHVQTRQQQAPRCRRQPPVDAFGGVAELPVTVQPSSPQSPRWRRCAIDLNFPSPALPFSFRSQDITRRGYAVDRMCSHGCGKASEVGRSLAVDLVIDGELSCSFVALASCRFTFNLSLLNWH
jgi:hypothetical protein